jgi:membrane protein required for beta-lactamase induction
VGIEARDPIGRMQREDIAPAAHRGVCVAATSEDGSSQAVYVVRVQNGVAWVDFMKGNGPIDWTAMLGPVIEAQAKGTRRVAFQTMRPGLVKKAQRQGYTVRGWILAKDIQ